MIRNRVRRLVRLRTHADFMRNMSKDIENAELDLKPIFTCEICKVLGREDNSVKVYFPEKKQIKCYHKGCYETGFVREPHIVIKDWSEEECCESE